MRISNGLKKQIIIIGGGNTFGNHKQYISFLKKQEIDFEKMKSAGWKNTLEKDMGKGFEVILLKMPNSDNAKYAEWKIWWEKIIPHLEKEAVLVGHSLGGIFLAKYLSENKFLSKVIKNAAPPLNLPLRLRKGRKKENKLSKNILATFLIAAPHDDEGEEYSLADFQLKKDLSGIQDQSEKLFIWQSADDKVVRLADFKKYKKALPKAICREFKNKGHFNQSHFPELVREIKKIFN